MVVDKIESMLPDDNVVTIEYKDCIIPIGENYFDIIVDGAESKKIAVWTASSYYIEIYDNNNK